MPSNIDLQESPRVHANYLSQIFFWWLNDLFRKGYQKNLEQNDLYKTLSEDESQRLGDRFYAEWETQVQKDVTSGKQSRKKLLRVLFKIFGPRFAAIGMFKFFEECVSKIAIPILLGYLIRFFTGEFNETVGLLCCCGIILCSISNLQTMHPYFLAIEHLSMKIRLTCSTALYKKALKLKLSSGGATAGQMMNLIANDVNRLDSLQHVHYLWIGLTQLAITSFILWNNFGPSCLCGLAILLLFIPLQGFLGGIFSKMRALSAKQTDRRIRIISELLKGIRSIKMHCWERTFASLVEGVRKDEMKILKRITALRSINWSLYYTSSKVAIFLTLIAYVINGNDLTPEIVFVGVSLYNNIRITMTLHFPLGINQLAEFFVTVKRVEEFLLIEEQKRNENCNTRILTSANNTRQQQNNNQGGKICLKNVSAKWDTVNVISGVDMEVSSHQLVMVVGAVGSGKSSLILTLLQELPLTKGTLEIQGKISYAGQTPWLFCGTVRENILLGRPFESEWYAQVVEACALTRDFGLFSNGDQTMIGDDTLSGGQRARINFARAVYHKDADVYLLDDVFSAVDVPVQRHILKKCVQNLLKNKLVILVTHQLQFLSCAHHIFVMEKGRFIAHGTYDELLNNKNNNVSVLFHDNGGEEGGSTETQSYSVNHYTNSMEDRRRTSTTVISNGSVLCSNYNVGGDNQFERRRSNSQGHYCKHERTLLDDTTNNDNNNPSFGVQGGGGEGGDIQSVGEFDEEKSSGSVNFSVYQRFFLAGSNICLFLLLIVFNVLTQTLHTGSDYWLQIWAKFHERNVISNVTVKTLNYNITRVEKDDNNYSTFYATAQQDNGTPNNNIRLYEVDFSLNNQILIYTSIIVFLFIFSMVRTTVFFEICLSASTKLHRKMLKAIMGTSMKFFDLNPTGRILNRFTKDTKLMDEDLPQTFFECTEIFLNIIGIIVLVCIVSPYILIPTILLSIAFYYVRRIYVRSARSVQRLEAIARSPVYSHISATLNNGLTTIRAFQVEQDFHAKFCHYQDLHSSSWYLTIVMTRWVGMWLDWISVTFISAVVLSLTLSAQVSGAAAGMAISSAMFLNGVFQWGVRQSATVESQMVSIERILDYTELTSEAAATSSPERKPPEGWPSEGNIEFIELNLQYNEDDRPTLKNISFQIKSKEKIGIVGRTGAGKSSLITAIFRLTEPSSGRIEIDGIDILQIGLQDLRLAISIIPQNPFLVQGTLRNNLSTNSSDAQLWAALQNVGLADTIKACPGGLDTEINEGGSNFSIGERQLFCLARELLDKKKILILDEASASIDERTDVLVQKTIREQFQDCTVLTIAHRLSTIMDSDRILVMDEGMVKEFDDPYMLLQNHVGFLSTMVDQTGQESSGRLRRIAEQAYLRKGLNTDLPEDNESSL